MKKIMIALASIGFAVSVQAASVYWTCTYVSNAKGYVNGGVAYFVNGDTLSKATLQGLTGATAVSAALADFYSYTGAADSDGKYSVAIGDAVANSTLGLSDATKYENIYLCIFDTSTITDNSNYYLTDLKTVTTGSATAKKSIAWGDQEDASKATGAWTAVNAPEPTSGLLLLIGMAGLALRRRRG